MYDVKEFINLALNQQHNLLKIYEKQLEDLPEGNLSLYEKKGKSSTDQSHNTSFVELLIRKR